MPSASTSSIFFREAFVADTLPSTSPISSDKSSQLKNVEPFVKDSIPNASTASVFPNENNQLEKIVINTRSKWKSKGNLF